MKKLTLSGLALLILSFPITLVGQTVTNKTALQDFAARKSIETGRNIKISDLIRL